MSKHLSYLYLIPRLARSLFRRPITVAYPRGPLALPAPYRGRIGLEIDACRGCGRCATDCPSGALEVERLDGGGVRVTHWHDRCLTCGQCELACPSDAIHLQADFVPAAPGRAAFVERWERPPTKT